MTHDPSHPPPASGVAASPVADTGFSELSRHPIDPASVKLLGDGFCRKKHVVILGQVDPEGRDPVTVGMLDPQDAELTRRLQSFLNRPIAPLKLSAEEILKALDIGHGRFEPDPSEASLALEVDHAAEGATERSAQAVIDELLERAVTLGASDVHIERRSDAAVVRLRIDGVLHPLPTPLSPDNVDAVITRLAAIGQLELSDESPAGQGRVAASFGPAGRRHPMELRVSIMPGPDGADAVLRLRGHTTQVIDLAGLGLEVDRLPVVHDMLSRPEGLLVVTGPARSGRSTTLYAMLGALDASHRKILTIEEAIERPFEGMQQKSVGPAMGFGQYAAAALGQDPDVVMLGAVPDAATAEAAARVVEAGHVALVGLPARDAVSAITRLRALDLSSERVAEILTGVIAQRLVRRICAACREAASDDPIADAAFARLGRRFAHARGRGCERCHGSGHAGRIAIFEVLPIDGALADRIALGRPAGELRRSTRDTGLRTLYDAALAWVERGELSMHEVQRCVPRPPTLPPAPAP